MDFNDVAIVSIKENNYRIHIGYMSKDDATNIMENFNLKKCIILLFFFFVIYKKMSGTTYYQRNKEVMLNRAKEYYENNKEVLREKAKNKYRELPEEEKI